MRPVRLGVVGNMSPAADELFQSYLRVYSEARTDQEHPCVIVAKNPDIPDRTAYIFGEAPDPTDEVAKTIRLLEGAGAGFIAMPCNTVHYCYDAIQSRTALYVLNMVKEATADVLRHGAISRVGLLATAGTIRSRLYHRELEPRGVAVLVPDEENRRRGVHAAIYGKDGRGGLKAGEFDRNVEALVDAVGALKKNGAEAVLLGCTELPLAMNRLRSAYSDIVFIDPMAVVARRCVSIYRMAERTAEEWLGEKPARALPPFPRESDGEVVPTVSALAEYVAAIAVKNERKERYGR
ncbi:MAG: amino acid racemase [Rickettsiales bacterium]